LASGGERRHSQFAKFANVKTITANPVANVLSAAGVLPAVRARNNRRGARIEVCVEKIQQLFNSMDPSPFHEKDLDRQAEEFIVSRLQEFSLHDHVSLVIHFNQNPANEQIQNVVETAVHNHFLYRAKLKRMELDRLLKQGRTSLLIGLGFLAACLVMSELLLLQKPDPLIILLRESLTIAGWVAMWQPMQIFLYEWWPLRRMGNVYKKLSHMRVEAWSH
jgi:hypothetical protein